MRHMRRLDGIRGVVAVCVFAFLIASGCGGGGSEDSGTAGSYGKVGVLLTDGPSDEYDHIWVTITEVSLLPAGDDRGVVIFSSDEGYRFDLLAYRDEDFLLRLNDRVPVGTYEKVRLKVLRVEAQGGECDEMDIDVPSGKIDLNPQGSFEVRADNTIYIRLDIDANKSINLHPAGSSDLCKFRPVVFVDIISKQSLPECPIFMKGEVSAPSDADDDPFPESFTLIRGEDACLGSVTVLLDEDTLVFREDGTFGSVMDIHNGQNVTVRGRVGEGCVSADLIIIGNILPVCGTVRNPVSDAGFVLEPSIGEWVLGTPNVILDEQTPVVSGCTTPVGTLAEGMRVIVLGKYDMTTGRLYAAIVLVKSNERTGTINAVEEVEGGYDFTITFDGEENPETIFMSSSSRITIEGDGIFPDAMIPLLNLHDYRVRVIQRYDGTIELKIVPCRVTGKVEDISLLFTGSLIVFDESLECNVNVSFMPPVIGIDTTGDGDCLVSYFDIHENDIVTCFGFWRISGEFLAFAFIIDDKEISAE